MRCRFTALVLLKNTAANFFFFFSVAVVLLSSFGCGCQYGSGIYYLPRNHTIKAYVFLGRGLLMWNIERRPGCFAGFSCSVCRLIFFILPAAAYSGINYVNNTAYDCCTYSRFFSSYFRSFSSFLPFSKPLLSITKPNFLRFQHPSLLLLLCSLPSISSHCPSKG